MKRRVIFEQDDNLDNFFNNEDYLPERGEAFYQGFTGGLVSAGRVVLILTICLIIYLLVAC